MGHGASVLESQSIRNENEISPPDSNSYNVSEMRIDDYPTSSSQPSSLATLSLSSTSSHVGSALVHYMKVVKKVEKEYGYEDQNNSDIFGDDVKLFDYFSSLLIDANKESSITDLKEIRFSAPLLLYRYEVQSSPEEKREYHLAILQAIEEEEKKRAMLHQLATKQVIFCFIYTKCSCLSLIPLSIHKD
jgi:hypothetical protein